LLNEEKVVIVATGHMADVSTVRNILPVHPVGTMYLIAALERRHADVSLEEKVMRTMPSVHSDKLIYIETHESDIPWLKIFTQVKHKEFSECSREEKKAIWNTLDVIEKMMLEYYKPEKINIASFGNMLPHVHWHIMARFKNDSHFPEPMWGVKQRESTLELPPLELFLEALKERL